MPGQGCLEGYSAGCGSQWQAGWGPEPVSSGEEAALPRLFGFSAKLVPEAGGWRGTVVHGALSPGTLQGGWLLLGGMLLAGAGG